MPPISHLSSGLYKFSSPDSNESWDKVFTALCASSFNQILFLQHLIASLLNISVLNVKSKALMTQSVTPTLPAPPPSCKARGLQHPVWGGEGLGALAPLALVLEPEWGSRSRLTQELTKIDNNEPIYMEETHYQASYQYAGLLDFCQ